MKKILLISVAFIVSIKTIAQQDTLTPVSTLNKLKPGIYLKYSEFINNTPSITMPFKAIPEYTIVTKDSLTKDSVISGYYYEFSDSTFKHKKVFGFFDGKQFYIDTRRGISLEKQRLFFPVDYIGRYSFIETKSKRPITLLTLGFASILDQAISGKKDVILYFNKNGEFLEATPQAIGFLLKKDKDFVKEFDAEQKLNNDVFKKYILKMNQRYPL